MKFVSSYYRSECLISYQKFPKTEVSNDDNCFVNASIQSLLSAMNFLQIELMVKQGYLGELDFSAS